MSFHNEHVQENCACLRVLNPEGKKLSPICFMRYLKSLSRNISDTPHVTEDQVGEKTPPTSYINPEEIMFCSTADGLFDDRYPGYVRDTIGISSWDRIRNVDHLHTLLTWTYWYRKFGKSAKLQGLLQRLWNIWRSPHWSWQYNKFATLSTVSWWNCFSLLVPRSRAIVSWLKWPLTSSSQCLLTILVNPFTIMVFFALPHRRSRVILN